MPYPLLITPHLSLSRPLSAAAGRVHNLLSFSTSRRTKKASKVHPIMLQVHCSCPPYIQGIYILNAMILPTSLIILVYHYAWAATAQPYPFAMDTYATIIVGVLLVLTLDLMASGMRLYMTHLWASSLLSLVFFIYTIMCPFPLPNGPFTIYPPLPSYRAFLHCPHTLSPLVICFRTWPWSTFPPPRKALRFCPSSIPTPCHILAPRPANHANF